MSDYQMSRFIEGLCWNQDLAFSVGLLNHLFWVLKVGISLPPPPSAHRQRSTQRGGEGEGELWWKTIGKAIAGGFLAQKLHTNTISSDSGLKNGLYRGWHICETHLHSIFCRFCNNFSCQCLVLHNAKSMYHDVDDHGPALSLNHVNLSWSYEF